MKLFELLLSLLKKKKLIRKTWKLIKPLYKFFLIVLFRRVLFTTMIIVGPLEPVFMEQLLESQTIKVERVQYGNFIGKTFSLGFLKAK